MLASERNFSTLRITCNNDAIGKVEKYFGGGFGLITGKEFLWLCLAIVSFLRFNLKTGGKYMFRAAGKRLFRNGKTRRQTFFPRENFPFPRSDSCLAERSEGRQSRSRKRKALEEKKGA